MQAENGANKTIQAHCCIVGGGPAGMMLGYLMARAGVNVVVLEKHADFLRDFRGDTVHPSTLELIYELGILEDLLRCKHQELPKIGAMIDDFSLTVGDFSHLPTHCKFVALMPQWDFLNFIAEKAKVYPQFRLLMQCEAIGLLIEDGQVTGVRAKTPDGELEVRARLTIGADGRHSVIRKAANFELIDLGAPIDVLWMRITRKSDDPEQTLGRFRAGTILVTLNRGDYWQCAFVIPKGDFETIQKRGLPAFRENVEKVAPFFRGRMEGIKSWDDIKLLAVAVDRLRHWSRPGLLCIGDSAHAMSPIGGVGINLAIQDAVAAANVLAAPLARGDATPEQLRKVQERREFPTRVTQSFQVFAHRRFIHPALKNKSPIRNLPLPLWMLQHFPALRRIPARMVGLGIRPEHIRSPDIAVIS